MNLKDLTVEGSGTKQWLNIQSYSNYSTKSFILGEVTELIGDTFNLTPDQVINGIAFINNVVSTINMPSAGQLAANLLTTEDVSFTFQFFSSPSQTTFNFGANTQFFTGLTSFGTAPSASYIMTYYGNSGGFNIFMHGPII